MSPVRLEIVKRLQLQAGLLGYSLQRTQDLGKEWPAREIAQGAGLNICGARGRTVGLQATVPELKAAYMTG